MASEGLSSSVPPPVFLLLFLISGIELRTLLGVESGLSDIQLGDDSSLHGLSSMPEIKKSKRKTGGGMELDSPSLATPSSGQKKVHTFKSAAFGTLAPFTSRQPHRSHHRRRAELYHAYRILFPNGSDEILSPIGRPPIIQTPNAEAGDGHEGRSDAPGTRC